MQKIVKRGLALLLCAVLALGAMSLTPSQAQEAPAPQGQSDYGPLTVYGKAGETTFVPAGYTYVYEEEDGSVYTREAARDMYISQRVLTPQEAEALAGLEGGETRYLTAEDGSVLQCQDFDAQEAAQYSQAVREILGDAPLDQGEEISLRSEVYTQESWVKAMVIFEDAPVASMESMSVRLGQPLGQAEQTAMARIAAQQAVQTQALEKKLGYDLQVSDHFTLLTNAISVTVQYGDLQKLNRQPGVKAAFLMPAFSVPESEAPVVQSASQFLPNMHSAGPAMGATGAWDLGYQGEGTLGRSLLEGVRSVKLFGEEIAVHAKIVNFQGLSSHADRDHLLAWIADIKAPKPQHVFIVHGDREVAPYFAESVEKLGFTAHAPQYTEVYDLIEDQIVAPGYLPERKAKAVGGQRVSSAYERLVALGQRMVDVIRRSKGRDNKTLGRWADQLRQLLDKWEES